MNTREENDFLRSQVTRATQVQLADMLRHEKEVKEYKEVIEALCGELEGTTKTKHTWDLVNMARELAKPI